MLTKKKTTWNSKVCEVLNFLLSLIKVHPGNLISIRFGGLFLNRFYWKTMHWCADIWKVAQKFSDIRGSEQSAFSCYLIQIVFCKEQSNWIPHWNLPPPNDSSNIVRGSKYSTVHWNFKGCSFQTLYILFPHEHPQWGISENNICCGFPGVSKAITGPWFYRSSILPTEIFCFLLIEILIHLLLSTLIFSCSSEWTLGNTDPPDSMSNYALLIV